jgi:hypothetical protein
LRHQRQNAIDSRIDALLSTAAIAKSQVAGISKPPKVSSR